MAAVAVVALGATVVASYRALSDASEVVVRGEGDLLLGALVSDLGDEVSPASVPALERALAAHRAGGLRYVAVLDRDGSPIAEAGHAEMPRAAQKPGESRIEGRRARVTGMLFPPRRGMRPPPIGAVLAGRPERPLGAALLVVEHEPPVIETLRRDLERIGIVAAVAGCVLLAFAIAWSRSARRLEALETRAARDERLVALGSMSSVMAHELRNPLASLKGHAQLLVEDLEDPSDKKKRAKAERVVSEAERLELLTTSLLDFVRDGPIERMSMTPLELVERSLEDLAKDRVKVDIDAAPSTVEVDPARLARAIHNLVDNALQAAPEGTVDLRIATEGADVVVAVRDHGPGLPEGSESRIFEPFITTRVRGTGLGLAVARRIAEQHDGTLTGENHPSGGAMFTLRFQGSRA
jgi:two-component system, NtrC family, sensor histidine kinase HydH